jgi:hypothetical protein
VPWNPYHDEWAAGRGLPRMRARLVPRYSFAVPGEEALACIARHAPIVEMGAGNGYWARCLRERGVDVVAYDEMGDQWRAYFRRPGGTGPELWTEVLRGGPERLAGHADRALLLCWPDPWSGMDEASLRAYPGGRVLYVGEPGGGGPGTAGFRRLLALRWRLVERVPVPRWARCRDRLTVYVRA